MSSMLVSSKQIKVCLGWHENPCTSSIVSCKKLNGEGLHTFKDMVGYNMKDNKEERFEFVHHIVLWEDMNDGKMEYTKLGKVGLNICASLSHRNVFQKAHQWVCF